MLQKKNEIIWLTKLWDVQKWTGFYWFNAGLNCFMRAGFSLLLWALRKLEHKGSGAPGPPPRSFHPLFKLRWQEWAVAMRQQELGSGWALCPVLNKSLQTETRMPGGLRLGSLSPLHSNRLNHWRSPQTFRHRPSPPRHRGVKNHPVRTPCTCCPQTTSIDRAASPSSCSSGNGAPFLPRPVLVRVLTPSRGPWTGNLYLLPVCTSTHSAHIYPSNLVTGN